MDGPAAVQGALGAHDRLLRALDAIGLDDATARRPSALPGWRVGHVLTHLARNGDSHRRMIDAAIAGGAVAQYPGGSEQRASEIDAGAGRGAVALLDDLRRSGDGLAGAYVRVDTDTWQRDALRWDGRPWPVLDLPFLRWREVAIHAVDLGLEGIGREQWDGAYLDHELRRQIASLGPRLQASVAVRLVPADATWSTVVMAPGELPNELVTVSADSAELLAWTVGRSAGAESWPALSPWVGAP